MADSSPWPPALGCELDLLVRDYECDMQGIVNHAVYLHYLEHARHQFLQSIGLDFDALTRAKVFLVVVRAEIDYKLPLRSADRFRVRSGLARVSPLRFAFRQEIRRRADDRLNVSARIVCAAVNERGRPFLPVEIAALLTAG